MITNHTQFMDQIIVSAILEKYLNIAINYLPRVIRSNKHYQFKCNICGDSKKNNASMRGHLGVYIDPNKSPEPRWNYKCWNGGCNANKSWSAEYWLKRSFPTLHSEFIKELIMNKKPTKEIQRQIEYVSQKRKEKYIKLIEKEKNEKHCKEMNDIKHFIPILKSDGEMFKKAIQVCKDRKIPKKIYKKFYICCEDGFYKNRMIIPFYDQHNKIYYWQARSLDGSTPKYLNKRSDKEKSAYNLYNINKNEPVIVLEGAIDSMFIENSIGVCGVEISEYVQNILDELDTYYLFDNDKTGRYKADRYLKDGKNVFLWKKFKYYDPYAEKQDINQIFIENNLEQPFTFEELKSNFSSSIYDSVFI